MKNLDVAITEVFGLTQYNNIWREGMTSNTKTTGFSVSCRNVRDLYKHK